MQHAQAAALGLASYKARVTIEFLQEGALNFAGIARVHLEFRGGGAESLAKFRSLYSTQCLYTTVYISLCVACGEYL